MASIRKEVSVETDADTVWAAVRDFGAVHQRLGVGFAVDCRLEENARVVTFSNGTTARELLVDLDDQARRLVYAIVGGRITTHSASMQVTAERAKSCKIIWITDVLPNELAAYISGQMDLAAVAMKHTLEQR